MPTIRRRPEPLRLLAGGMLAWGAVLTVPAPAEAQQSTQLETIEVAGAGGAALRGQAGTSSGRAADPNGPESAFGPVKGYIAKRSASGTKTDTPLKDTPQSISVVSEEQARDQGATSVQEALRYTPGVLADSYGPDVRGDYPRIRGSDPDIFLDGLRLTNSQLFNEPRPDPYTLSRFEVLRGPASALYGSTPIAGLINLVSKRPLDVEYREIGMQFGSFERAELRTDMTGRLTEDGQLLYRFIGLGRLSNSQTDFAINDRYLINPSITWRPDADTSWTLIGLHQKDSASPGIVAFLPREGTLFPGPNGFIPFNRFTGDPRTDAYRTETTALTSLFEHRFDETFTVRQNLRYTHIDGSYDGIFPNVYSDPLNPFIDPDRRVVDRLIFRRDTVKDRIATDQSLEARFETGPVAHLVLAGIDFRQLWERASSASGVVPPLDLYDPVYLPVSLPALAPEPRLSQNQLGFYIQDQMRLGPWIVLASVRRDFVTSEGTGLTPATSYSQENQATTGRIALMYQFDFGLSPYVSYATSFTPIFGGGLCGTGAVCQPQLGEQVEAGLKFNPVPWLTVNAAAFDTIERNRLVPDPANPFFQTQAGKVGVQGGEIELLATIAENTDVIAGYSYTDAVNLTGPEAGLRLATVPLHLASLWVRHRFSLFGVAGFQAGAGVRYIGESFDGAGGPFVTPSATLFDAMVGWEDARWRAQVTAANVTDEQYLTTCLARGDCFLGTRRTVLGTLTYKF